MRAPMTIVKGYLQILLSGMVGDVKSEHRKLIEQSVGSVEELILLVDNMMQAATLENGNISLTKMEADVDLLLSEVIDFYEPTLQQRGITIERAQDARGLRLEIDPFWVKRVLHNLVWNAYKFTPDGGRVTLRVQPASDGIEIAVEDTGRGIAADKLDQIFGKFQQADRGDRSFGSGIGLWICRQVMELHGGTVRVESSDGQGSRFILSFPD
jgi:signal transduction histidine kinase